MTAASRESSAATDACGVLKSSGARHIEGGSIRPIVNVASAASAVLGRLRQQERYPMSKHPSPRADQLRAMREAQFARHQQLQQETEREEAGKPVEPARSAARKSKEKKG